jgi:hypothetical protein
MKTTLTICILAAGVTSLSAQPGDRERGQRPDPAAIFERADTNKDTFLDLTEFTAFRATVQRGPRGNRGPNAGDDTDAARPPRGERQGPQAGQGRPEGRGPRNQPTAEEMFATMDKNDDGKIAQDEFTLGNRQGRGPGRGPGEGAKKPE